MSIEEMSLEQMKQEAQRRFEAALCIDCAEPVEGEPRTMGNRSYYWCESCSAPEPTTKQRTAEERKERNDKLALAKQNHTYRVRSRDRVGMHDISKAEYDSMLEAQGRVCASCGREPTLNRMLAIDHDHTCNPYIACLKCTRGLLCSSCNTGMGMLGDTLEGLQRALRYLELHRDKS